MDPFGRKRVQRALGQTNATAFHGSWPTAMMANGGLRIAPGGFTVVSSPPPLSRLKRALPMAFSAARRHFFFLVDFFLGGLVVESNSSGHRPILCTRVLVQMP